VATFASPRKQLQGAFVAIIKITCDSCGKHFSGEIAKINTISSCPKCKASGDWWTELLPGEPIAAAHSQNEPVLRNAQSNIPATNKKSIQRGVRLSLSSQPKHEADNKQPTVGVSAPAKLRICPDCGHQVSPHAEACPSCGKPFINKEIARANAVTTAARFWLAIGGTIFLIGGGVWSIAIGADYSDKYNQYRTVKIEYMKRQQSREEKFGTGTYSPAAPIKPEQPANSLPIVLIVVGVFLLIFAVAAHLSKRRARIA